MQANLQNLPFKYVYHSHRVSHEKNSVHVCILFGLHISNVLIWEGFFLVCLVCKYTSSEYLRQVDDDDGDVLWFTVHLKDG